MRAGTLRHVVVCDEPTLNDAGEITGFVPAFSQRASIEPLRGREQLHANQIIADMDTLICVRWSPRTDSIRPTWRLRHGDTVYNISSLAHINMGKREIEIVCKSGLNNG
jgi:SPP1 family predicted phage head-tail adaptor